MGKRGTPCSVCEHEARHQIEIGLTHGVSHRVLGKKFELSHDAIGRHARSHLTPQVKAAILSAQKPTEIDLDALRTSEAEGLLSQLVMQRARLQTHVELAAGLGDVRGCVAAEGTIISNLTLVAKLLNMLSVQHNVTHTSILVSADYLRLRSTLLTALRPFPEAARAVSAALHTMEADAATDITARAKGKASAIIEHAPLIIPPPPC